MPCDYFISGDNPLLIPDPIHLPEVDWLDRDPINIKSTYAKTRTSVDRIELDPIAIEALVQTGLLKFLHRDSAMCGISYFHILTMGLTWGIEDVFCKGCVLQSTTTNFIFSRKLSASLLHVSSCKFPFCVMICYTVNCTILPICFFK